MGLGARVSGAWRVDRLWPCRLSIRSRPLSPAAGRKGPVAVLGGGPAGLTAGYLLAKKGVPVIVFEAEDQVGGLAKTEVRDGYRFDLGGHRFFTKSQEVDDLWHEVMKRGVPAPPAHVAHLLERQVPRLPARRHGRHQEARPDRADPLRPLLPVGAASSPRARRRTSSSGSPTASASGSTSTSSRPTPRRCGACRPPSCAPSGRPSGSRASRSPPPPRPRSSATRATRSSR